MIPEFTQREKALIIHLMSAHIVKQHAKALKRDKRGLDGDPWRARAEEGRELQKKLKQLPLERRINP